MEIQTVLIVLPLDPCKKGIMQLTRNINSLVMEIVICQCVFHDVSIHSQAGVLLIAHKMYIYLIIYNDDLISSPTRYRN